MLQIGSAAPAFCLPDQDGVVRSLADYLGRKVVLYFYPKDSTAGCAAQAQLFTELKAQFEAVGATVVGVSKDSVKSHKRFEEKFGLGITLLSDPDLAAIQAYGVWQEKTMCGKTGMGVVRSTFVIDENGMLEGVFMNVKAKENPAKMLAFVSGQ